MLKCGKCGCSFSSYAVIDGKPRNLASRKYCLSCSPFGNHNTAKLHQHPEESYPDNHRYCPKCETTKHLDFFYKYKNGQPHGWCKRCLKKDVIKRQHRLKVQAILYKGGKCFECGAMPHPAAMAFHHRDPDKKDFNISRYRVGTLEAIKDELDKCDLVCHNCHAIIHVQHEDWDWELLGSREGFEPSTQGLKVPGSDH